MMELSIVVPVHNEEANVRPLVNEIEQVLAASGLDGEMVFVDDGSRDSTQEQLRQLRAEYPASESCCIISAVDKAQLCIPVYVWPGVRSSPPWTEMVRTILLTFPNWWNGGRN